MGHRSLAPALRTIVRLAPLACCFVLLAMPSVAHAVFPGANGKIAFVSTRDDPSPTGCGQSCNFEIYSMNADGSGETRLTVDAAQDLEPTWSPDGSKIAFTSNRDGDYDIYTMNANGTGVLNVTNNTGWDKRPEWSPDGQKITFLRDPYNLVIDATGGSEVVVGDGSLGVSAAGWSPDAQQLAYGYYDTGIFKVDADGSDTVQIGGAGRYNEYARWSPDGRDVVFVADKNYNDYTLQLYLVGADGTGQHELPGTVTTNCSGFMSPSWSPNGTRIAFVSDAGALCGPPGSAQVWTVNRDGTGAARLTPADPADVVSFTWSPDGTKLAFDRYAISYSDSDIFVVNGDGTGQVPLTSTAGVDADPDWQPLRAMSPFPRPGGGSPLITYLVPAYERCTSPNSQHVAPLAEGSCTPPVQTSDLLTTSTIGAGKGFVRLDTIVGNPATGADEADVRIESLTTDVRNASDQSDYTGQVLLSSVLRITDRASGFGGVSATVSDFRFDVPVSCTPSAPAPGGSDCLIMTTADSLVPGMVTEGKRSVVSTHNFQLLDAGTDGDVTPASGCPPACGTGDEETYLEQGTFTP